MPSIHQSNVSAYHRAVAASGHHGGHNMHLFHRDWHQTNRDPIPPLDRPDPEWGANLVFGTNFLQMHHEMVKAVASEPHYHMMHASIVQWFNDSAIALPSEWNPTSSIPAELGYEPDVNEFPEEIKSALMNSAANQGVSVETLLQRRSDHPSFSLPLWFTREGVPDGANGEPITGARKLADFKNTNQLGCCIVFPHNSWHGAIGGAMRSTWTAIADPIFYFGVHWIIDRVFDEYKIIEAERRITPLDVVRLRNRRAIPSTTVERNLPAEFTQEQREEFYHWRLLSEEVHAPPTEWGCVAVRVRRDSREKKIAALCRGGNEGGGEQ